MEMLFSSDFGGTEKCKAQLSAYLLSTVQFQMSISYISQNCSRLTSGARCECWPQHMMLLVWKPVSVCFIRLKDGPLCLTAVVWSVLYPIQTLLVIDWACSGETWWLVFKADFDLTYLVKIWSSRCNAPLLVEQHTWPWVLQLWLKKHVSLCLFAFPLMLCIDVNDRVLLRQRR